MWKDLWARYASSFHMDMQEWRTCNWYGNAHQYHGLIDKSYQLSHITQGMMVPQRPTMIVSLMT